MSRCKTTTVLAIRYKNFKEKVALVKKYKERFIIEDIEELSLLYMEKR